jgi:hypothetical protein
MLNVNAKAIAAAAIMQSKDDARYYLNGVYFEPLQHGGVTLFATDGHRMIQVTDTEGFCERPVILSFDPQAVTKMRHGKAERLTVSARGHDLIAEIGGIKHISYCEEIKGRFPDCRVVITRELPESSCQVAPINGSWLADFALAAKHLNVPNEALSVVHNEHATGVVCVLIGRPAEKALQARGCIMPMRFGLSWDIGDNPVSEAMAA